MAYRIGFAADEDMPDGDDYVLIGGAEACVLFFRESFRHMTLREMAGVLEEAWEGYRELTEAHGIPTQRTCGPEGVQVLDNVTLARMLAEIV